MKKTTRRAKTMMTSSDPRNPHEADEQKLLFEWAEYAEVLHPELELLHHLVNEGKRSYWSGCELRKQGMRAGVPDICLPVPRGGDGALYIEMKRKKGGTVSERQRWWIDKLNAVGNKAVVCHGFDEAKDAILAYLQQ